MAPDSDAARLYNDKVAPILGVAIDPDGSAKELDGAMSGGTEPAKLISQGENIEIQLVCINRTGNPCTLIYSTEEEHGIDGFIERVRDRTEGQVDFQISSFPELGLAGPDSLRLIEDRTMGAGRDLLRLHRRRPADHRHGQPLGPLPGPGDQLRRHRRHPR